MPQGYGGVDVGRERPAERSPGWRVAVVVLVAGAVAVAAFGGAHMHRQAVALYQDSPQLAADQGRLKRIEQGLMGLSGATAMRQAKKAQELQGRIQELKRGGYRVENLATVPDVGAADFASGPAPRPAGGWAAQPAAEERGSFARGEGLGRALHFGDSTAEPLDLTPEGQEDSHAQASVLAANLRRWGASHASPPPPPLGARARPPVGYVAVRTFSPGDRLPKGARVISPQILARVARAEGGVFERVPQRGASGRVENALMLLEGDNATSATEGGSMTVEGNSSLGNSSFEVVDARPPPPSPPPPVWVGNTNMTIGELKAYAANLENDAMALMDKVTRERQKALHSLEVGEGMVQRGWAKHLRAQAMVGEAKNLTQNATALMAGYRWGMAGARAAQSARAATEMSEIAQSLTAEAEERGEAADKWMGFLKTLRNVGGKIVDPEDPLPGEPPVWSPGGNGTNTTEGIVVYSSATP